MSKFVRAYFASENDAESVHADLHTLKVNNVLVDTIPDDFDTNLVVPIAAVNAGGNATNVSNGLYGALTGVDLNEGQADNPEDRTHVLEFKVDEQDFKEAMNILQKHDGYIEKSVFE